LKRQFLNSLRSRYLAASIVLGLLVISSAYLTHLYVNNARQQSIVNLESRNLLLQHSRLARNSVWKSRELLEAFLLEPENTSFKDNVYKSIRDAATHAQTLSELLRATTAENSIVSEQLQKTLAELEKHADILIKTRSDSTKQFPALFTARKYMLPNHRIFYTAASLALDEMTDDIQQSESLDNEDKYKAYQTLIQARHLWTQMISNFRMYLANRMGSFDKAILPIQEHETDVLYQELVNQLLILKSLDASEKLGFQASTSLEELTKAAANWYIGFREIKRINASNEWRADIKLLKEDVHPLLEATWNLLLSIDISIESSANDDVKKLTGVARNQTQLLWLLTALGLIAIIIGFILLESQIIKPISTVAQALKAKAIGVEGTALPITTLLETQDLIDAFTEMNKQVNARQVDLEYQALHDSLTGLPNRTLLLDRLQQAIFTARREHNRLALLIMDLDGFKEVNDTVGHQIGDSLLKEVGVRLLMTIREMDTVARLGGDEFAVLLPDSNDIRAMKVAAKMRESLEEVFEIDDLRLHIGASVGVAVYPENGARAETLIQRADVAMYVAKRNKSGQALYNPKEDQHSVGRLALMSDLRHALDIDSLQLHYQPKIDIKLDKVIGVEALLRWNHPKFGAIPPDELIPLAEQTGLIKPLTRWVLNHAIKQTKSWLQDDIIFPVAINLSVYNLQDMEFIDQLKTSLTYHDLPTKYLSLEITESAMMANPAHAVEILKQLESMGIKISIDDFGTGFSSLSYLKQLPVYELKIDKSFVMDMTTDDDDAIIVRSTIELAHNLGLMVVAEGVESKEIWYLLEMLGCDMAQGMYLGAPMSVTALEKWFAKRNKQGTNQKVVEITK